MHRQTGMKEKTCWQYQLVHDGTSSELDQQTMTAILEYFLKAPDVSLWCIAIYCCILCLYFMIFFPSRLIQNSWTFYWHHDCHRNHQVKGIIHAVTQTEWHTLGPRRRHHRWNQHEAHYPGTKHNVRHTEIHAASWRRANRRENLNLHHRPVHSLAYLRLMINMEGVGWGINDGPCSTL